MIGKNNHIFYRLFMIKDFENSSEIDLDTSNVKNIPIKIYDYVDYIWPNKEKEILEKEMNDLAGVSPNHKCAFNFNIREYMKLDKKVKFFRNLKYLLTPINFIFIFPKLWNILHNSCNIIQELWNIIQK